MRRQMIDGERMVCSAHQEAENIYMAYAESFRGAGHLRPHAGGSADDHRRCISGLGLSEES